MKVYRIALALVLLALMTTTIYAADITPDMARASLALAMASHKAPDPTPAVQPCPCPVGGQCVCKDGICYCTDTSPVSAVTSASAPLCLTYCIDAKDYSLVPDKCYTLNGKSFYAAPIGYTSDTYTAPCSTCGPNGCTSCSGGGCTSCGTFGGCSSFGSCGFGGCSSYGSCGGGGGHCGGRRCR